MGIKSNPKALFSPAWVKAAKGAPESAMIATVLIYDPNVTAEVYDAETDTWETNVATPLYSGKARVQPIRSATNKEQPGDETTVIGVLASIPISTNGVDFRPGHQMDVLTSPLNTSLLTYQFVMQEILDSSNPLERTLYFTVNQETARG